MTPAADEFAEIAKRVAEIKALRWQAIVGEPEKVEQAQAVYGAEGQRGPVYGVDYGDCC